jgi:hypothetical protein
VPQRIDDFDDKELGALVSQMEWNNRAPVDPRREKDLQWRIESLVAARLDAITKGDYERAKQYLRT